MLLQGQDWFQDLDESGSDKRRVICDLGIVHEMRSATSLFILPCDLNGLVQSTVEKACRLISSACGELIQSSLLVIHTARGKEDTVASGGSAPPWIIA